MDLRQELLSEHNKEQAGKLEAWVGHDELRFGELVNLFLYDEYRVVQRASWVLSLVAERNGELVQPYMEALVNRLEEPGLPVAVKRNVMRLLQHVALPEALHGRVMNTAFRLLESPGEAIAVRVFSMSVLARLALEYPELKGELRLIIEDVLELGAATAAFRSRARKVLKALGS